MIHWRHGWKPCCLRDNSSACRERRSKLSVASEKNFFTFGSAVAVDFRVRRGRGTPLLRLERDSKSPLSTSFKRRTSFDALPHKGDAFDGIELLRIGLLAAVL